MEGYTYFKGCHTLVFYIADFPDVDPNVQHKMSDLYSIGLTAGNRQKGVNIVDEAIGVFGEEVGVIVNAYDLGKIAAMYDLNQNIHKCQFTSSSVIFGDGVRLVTIQKSLLKQCYMKTVVDTRPIYRLDVLCDDIDRVDVFDYLKKTFKRERNVEFEEDGIYRLSLEQVTHVQKMLPNVNLIGHYDNENGGNIFVQWTDPLWTSPDNDKNQKSA